uniref:MENTAL domain-containing protein n=1 Tax=Heterorhabditis bacteriophora TaxID=37862 RepID=A0A1I7X6K3_HETBA
MGSWHNDTYFFGEDYTMFNKTLHVVVAARLILFIETLLLLTYVIAVPLTIGFFDTISVFQILVCGSVLICAFLAMYRLEHRLFWPFMVIKGCEMIMYVFLFVIAVLLAAVRRSAILHIIRWRLNTVNPPSLSKLSTMPSTTIEPGLFSSTIKNEIKHFNFSLFNQERSSIFL